MMREYLSLRALRNGETVSIEGVDFRIMGDGWGLEPGDTYIAERNTGPKLLTVDRIVKQDSIVGGFICPKESPAYAYDVSECVKVEMVDENDS